MKSEFKREVEDKNQSKMSVKIKDDRSASTSLVACCQSTSTSPDNSIADYIEEDVETSNNNTLFHAGIENVNDSGIDQVSLKIMDKQTTSDPQGFSFPKRPKIDVEFQNIHYTVKQFSMKSRRFGK